MKKLFLIIAVAGMTGLAFGQQQQTATTSKDGKCTKACMKSCGDKSCKKGSCCTKDGKKTGSAATSSATKNSDTK